MTKIKPHNPPNLCKKCGGWRLRTLELIGVKRCECKTQQIPAKNIFEAVTTKMIRNGKNGNEISEACNALHQQALKEAEKAAWIEGSNAAHKLARLGLIKEKHNSWNQIIKT